MNAGDGPAEVSITGVDDAGRSSSVAASTTVPPRAVRSFTAAELESGTPVIEGALGAGIGKWQLVVESDRPISVMNILESPTGHVTNLSTAGRLTAGPPTAADVFRLSIAGPVVQAKCVQCHVAGGEAAETRLVFLPDSLDGHKAHNLRSFVDFLAQTEIAEYLVLAKVVGAEDHGGGAQLGADSEGYANLDRKQGRKRRS